VSIRARTDLELLASIVGRSAAKVGKVFGTFRELAQAGDADLLAAGLSEKKLAALRLALEAGARALDPVKLGREFSAPATVAEHYRTRLANLKQEEFWAMFLNARHQMVSEKMIGRGCLTGVDVHPREVFRTAIEKGAAAIIVAHNHPSGDPKPSTADIELTGRLRATGDLVGIRVLDHVVVATNGYASMAERGWT
jgi:DNA repair protein RadC